MAEGIGTDIAESSGIGGGTDTETVENCNDRAQGSFSAGCPLLQERKASGRKFYLMDKLRRMNGLVQLQVSLLTILGEIDSKIRSQLPWQAAQKMPSPP
ncbi:MAG: hypothetical protein Kow00104_04920 [Rhodothalassiaceae bacterium]